MKLGELCHIARGGSPRPIQDYITSDPDGINWVKISDATASEKYIEHTKQKIRPEGLNKSRRVNPGDFILSNSMSFGRPYIMKTTGAIHDVPRRRPCGIHGITQRTNTRPGNHSAHRPLDAIDGPRSGS